MENQFEYSADWYERVYHAGKLGGGLKDAPEEGEHAARDRACLSSVPFLPTDRILVTGCGGGNNLVALARLYPDCKSIAVLDFAPSAVTFCKNHFPYVREVVASVDDIPLPEGVFNKVLAMDVTEHLPWEVYQKFLREARRVLCYGGQFIVLPGMTRRPEHINLLPLGAIEIHLAFAGFRCGIMGKEWIVATK